MSNEGCSLYTENASLSIENYKNSQNSKQDSIRPQPTLRKSKSQSEKSGENQGENSQEKCCEKEREQEPSTRLFNGK